MDYLMSGDGSTGSAGWALDKLQVQLMITETLSV